MSIKSCPFLDCMIFKATKTLAIASIKTVRGNWRATHAHCGPEPSPNTVMDSWAHVFRPNESGQASLSEYTEDFWQKQTEREGNRRDRHNNGDSTNGTVYEGVADVASSVLHLHCITSFTILFLTLTLTANPTIPSFFIDHCVFCSS